VNQITVQVGSKDQIDAATSTSPSATITGTTATIDLPKPTLLPTSAMAAIRKRAWMGTIG